MHIYILNILLSGLLTKIVGSYLVLYIYISSIMRTLLSTLRKIEINKVLKAILNRSQLEIGGYDITGAIENECEKAILFFSQIELELSTDRIPKIQNCNYSPNESSLELTLVGPLCLNGFLHLGLLFRIVHPYVSWPLFSVGWRVGRIFW